MNTQPKFPNIRDAIGDLSQEFDPLPGPFIPITTWRDQGMTRWQRFRRVLRHLRYLGRPKWRRL